MAVVGAQFKWTNKPVALQVAADAVEKVATAVWAEAIRICPQDTGTLARSIAMRKEGAGESLRFVVGTNVNYAIFVEYGTKHMAAQPFLGPALAMAARKYT